MTGQNKTIIALSVVILLSATIFLTWLVTKRSLGKIQADQPPSLTTNSTSSTSATTQTTNQSTTTQTDSSAVTKIIIPLVKGWNQVSVPFFVSPDQGKSVFAKLSTQDAFYLDQDSQEYLSFFTKGSVSPGAGVFLRSESGESLELQFSSALAVDLTKVFTINLKKGWNLIGNPFNTDIFWNPTVEAGNRQLTLQQAIDEQVVSKSYSYSPSGGTYTEVKPGQTLTKSGSVLIKAGGDVKLLVISK